MCVYVYEQSYRSYRSQLLGVGCWELNSAPLEEPLLPFILRQSVLKLPGLTLADAVAPEEFEFTIFSSKSRT